MGSVGGKHGLWVCLIAAGCRFGFDSAGLAGRDASDGTTGGDTLDGDGDGATDPDSTGNGDATDDSTSAACSVITTDVGAGTRPSLTWSGTELAVAYLATTSRNPTLARVALGGGVVGTQATLASTTDNAIAAVWNGGGWGVAWTNQGTSGAVYFTRVDSSGVETGTEISEASDAEASQVDLGWNGSAYLLAWGDNYADTQVYVAALSSTGVIGGQDSVGTNMTGSYQPSLAWGNGVWGLAWSDTKFQMSNPFDHVAFNEVGTAGTAQGAQSQISDNLNDGLGNTAWLYPDLAWTGTHYAVAWQDFRDVGTREIYVAAINTSGARIGSDVRITNDAVASETPSLVWTGSELGLAWSDTDVRVARLNDSGTRVAADVTVAGTSGATTPSLVWTGTRYAVAYEASGAVHVALLCP